MPTSTNPSPVTITASYGVDVKYPQSSGSYSLQVTQGSTATSVSCLPSPVTVGSSSSCTATVTGSSPTGTITWTSNGTGGFSPATPCTIVRGTCIVSYKPSSTGSPVTITATYGGDVNYLKSSGSFSLSVTSSTSTFD